MSENIRIASSRLSAEISPFGAELRALRDGQGRDLLWDGDPAWWTGRAPILFPVIGVLNGGVYRIDGVAHPMPKHGFARHSDFAVAALAADMVALRLTDSEATRAVWPFAFTLDLIYTIAAATLTMEAVVTNADARPMPASFGYHPALRWPLPYDGSRAAHRIRFAEAEPDPVRRIDGEGLLRPDRLPTPIVGDTLALDDSLFVDDALILDSVRSRRLHFGAPGVEGLDVTFDDLPTLALWTKPGAPYLCIEPWQGIADPQAYAGDIVDKPGIVTIAPGESRRFTMTIALSAPEPA
ncbi:aldose 1-epimerase family protein [Sphingomonas naphthae]|uniref:Aldose 1-epimerase family protein n=1 Tax=Sphingomonas naphthae TaxID=1813468 RepID=A0ABY7TN22_9SPHN|nr:aldose 1-epimerase family protein [Sphingomonas naphthae]WCT73254.1 aldose 1-epimerase family protein [Sphingomonas naphthae]